MRRTMRLAMTALIGLLVTGCLIPVPVHHRWHDRDRYYDRDDRDHHRHHRDWDRDRRDWPRRDRDYDRRHR